jgi:MFS family permease
VLVVTIGLLFCCQSATLTHLVPRVTDMGYTLLEASAVMSFCAGAGVVGKLTFGWLVDRVRPRDAMLFAIGSQVLGQITMLYGSGYVPFVIGAAAFGFGMGGIVPLQGALVARRWSSFGRALGLMRRRCCRAVGVPFAGWVFDFRAFRRRAFLRLSDRGAGRVFRLAAGAQPLGRLAKNRRSRRVVIVVVEERRSPRRPDPLARYPADHTKVTAVVGCRRA